MAYLPATSPIRRAQFIQALEALTPGNAQALSDAVPASRGNPINIAYYDDPFVIPGGVLASFVQTTFRLSNTQMTALFTSAAGYTYGIGSSFPASLPLSSLADAQNGTRNDVLMTPAMVVAAITAYLQSLPQTLPISTNVPWLDGGVVSVSQ